VGVNRHGEGRPSTARWYQSTARIRRVGRSVVPRSNWCSPEQLVRRRAAVSALGRKRSAPRRRSSAGETNVRRRTDDRPPGTSPVAGSDPPARPTTGRADAAVPGCGRRPGPRRGRSQTPREAATRTDRGERCTTKLRPGLGRRPATGARRRSAPGCARSSRQLVAALVPPSLQHGTTCTGAHAVAEAVLASPATVVRLVGALQRGPSSDGHSSRCGGTS
jgi:hypothetical protein